MESLKRVPVLVIDDDNAMTNLLSILVNKEIFEVTLTNSGRNAITLLRENHFPLVLCDIGLGSMSGLDLIPHARAKSGTEIIFLTGQGAIDTAIRAVREGAFDYLCKSTEVDVMQEEINTILLRAAKHLGLVPTERYTITEDAAQDSKILIGSTPVMVAVYRSVARAAQVNGNVLITGESGTGKELVAQAIHEASPRAARPFIAVNCGALTETLFESELFGHVKGAFTGAICNKQGLFEIADGGTLFLDEIGDISLPSQVKFLRALQAGEIKPVGGSASKKVDVRVIAATHRDLTAMVAEGRFREDLYYRLKVFQIPLPPLRSRKEDLPLLVNQFVASSSARIGKKITGVAEEAMALLSEYSWPGNVRELENTIDRAVALSTSPILFKEDLPEEMRMKTRPLAQVDTSPLGLTSEQASSVPPAAELSGIEKLEEIEKAHIKTTLLKYHYNRTRAAEALGIDRVTLYRKMTRYSISAAV